MQIDYIRRKKKTLVFGRKKQIIEETYQSGQSVSQVARKYDITPSQLFVWRRQMEQGVLQGISSGEELVPKSKLKEKENAYASLSVCLVKDFRKRDFKRSG